MHTKDRYKNCERRRVIKDFCFPDGIDVKELKNSEKLNTAQKILYSSKSVRESCFVFTLNANDELASASETNFN